MTSRLKIYLAGKFVRDAGETTRNDWRYHLGMHAEGSARCLRSLSVPLKGLPFDGVGPFFVGMKAHEAWAGHDLAGSDGNMLMQVDVSELVQAWIK
ncbi:MAG: hypothetical protein U0794_23685, partial [Isosphaeraceae bacterium]